MLSNQHTNSQIVMLDPKKLHHHPENPRKNIGDITELADNIAVMGIMQNLTVVAYDAAIHPGLTVSDPDNEYVVVIGNRRLEAALKAGLPAVPCVIADMDRSMQLKTMIIENHMRENLTTLEQAECYQLMLDMGESIDDISKDIGLSPATIRRRVKLLALDRDALAEAEARGGTLQDYAKLDKIEDPALKNQVLRYIGTPSFQNELKQAISKEKNHKKILELIPQFEAFAKRIDKVDGNIMGFVQNTFCWDISKKFPVPKDAGTVQYYFYVGMQQIDLYKDRSAVDAEKEARLLLVSAEQRQYELLREASNRAYELRKDFIANFTSQKAQRMLPQITAYTLATACKRIAEYGSSMNSKAVAELLNIPMDDSQWNSVDLNALKEAVSKNPAYSLLVIGWAVNDSDARSYVRRNYNTRIQRHETEYRCDELLDKIYEFLCSLGYEMSEEELALQNGNHPLFGTNEEEQLPKAS